MSPTPKDIQAHAPADWMIKDIRRIAHSVAVKVKKP
jgi:hypothetical protein